MSRAGRLALQRVIIDYNSFAPTADGIRHAFSREIPQFKREFPTVTIEVRPRQQANAITGIYRDGSERSFSIISSSAMAVYARLHELASSANDRPVNFNTEQMHFQRRSVQGAWNPYLWLAERHEPRVPKPQWDRELTEDEWDFYVDRYSRRLKADREAAQDKIERDTEVPRQMSKEIARRWQKFVTPQMQTDVEHNLAQIKKLSETKDTPPDAVSPAEYRIFAAPDTAMAADDLARNLRYKEMRKNEAWWQNRKDQLKPPK